MLYVGLLADYVDTELLRGIARLPARLVLVGPDRSMAESVFGTPLPPNVEALGWLGPGDFERVVSSAWVGVVPYVPAHPRVLKSNPDKVYDYLLGGLMVVATPIDSLTEVPGLMLSQGRGFVDVVRKALDRYSSDVARHQRALGRLYSADAFAGEFLNRLSTLYQPTAMSAVTTGSHTEAFFNINRARQKFRAWRSSRSRGAGSR